MAGVALGQARRRRDQSTLLDAGGNVRRDLGHAALRGTGPGREYSSAGECTVQCCCYTCSLAPRLDIQRHVLTRTRQHKHIENESPTIYAGSVQRMDPLFISTTADFFTESMLTRLTVSDNTREITFLVVEGQGALHSMREHYGGAVRYRFSVGAGIFI